MEHNLLVCEEENPSDEIFVNQEFQKCWHLEDSGMNEMTKGVGMRGLYTPGSAGGVILDEISEKLAIFSTSDSVTFSN